MQPGFWWFTLLVAYQVSTLISSITTVALLSQRKKMKELEVNWPCWSEVSVTVLPPTVLALTFDPRFRAVHELPPLVVLLSIWTWNFLLPLPKQLGA